MHYEARHVLLDVFSTNQGNSFETTFVARATKSTSTFEKPSYDWMTQCKKQSEGIDYMEMEDLKLWQILAEVLLQLIS